MRFKREVGLYFLSFSLFFSSHTKHNFSNKYHSKCTSFRRIIYIYNIRFTIVVVQGHVTNDSDPKSIILANHLIFKLSRIHEIQYSFLYKLGAHLNERPKIS